MKKDYLKILSDTQIAFLSEDPHMIFKMPNPSQEAVCKAIECLFCTPADSKKFFTDEKMQKEVCCRDCRFAKFLPNLSEEVQLSMVESNAYFIRCILNPSHSVQHNAVQKNGLVIQYIRNPSEDIKLAAVEQNGNAIQYMRNRSRELELKAVQNDCYAIRHIQHPTRAMMIAAVKKDPHLIEGFKNPPFEVQDAAVSEDPDAICWINSPYEEIQLKALRKKPELITKLVAPSLKAIYMVIKKIPVDYIDYIDFQDDDSQRVLCHKIAYEMVKRNHQLIDSFPTANLKTQLEAIKDDWANIVNIEDPYPSVQLCAVKQNLLALALIKNPTVQCKRYVAENYKG